MNPMLVILFAMEFVSLMLAVVLITAWKSFGSPRHALTWFYAFIIAAVDWFAHILLVSVPAGHGGLSFCVHLLSIATWGVMLIGFRQRVGQETQLRPAAIVAAGATLALALAAWSGHHPLIGAGTLLFSAAMIALSARTMMRRPSMPAERAVVVMLLAFSLLHLVAGSFTLTQGAFGVPQRHGAAEVMMMLTLPSAFTGVGLFSVFLLAADLADRMGRLAASDPLTRALNRRGFEEAAAEAIDTARRQNWPLTIAVADLDGFKAINDRHGHAVGDRVLCVFVEHVSRSLGAGDLVGRLGGEEFALLLVGLEPAAAVEAVDRIRIGIAHLTVPGSDGPVCVTSSFGVSGPAGPDDTLADMIHRADEALYRSKMSGRNCVTLAPPPRNRPEQAVRASADGSLRAQAVT